MNQAQASGVAHDKRYKKEQKILQLKLDSILNNKFSSFKDKSVRAKRKLRNKEVNEFADKTVISD